MKITPEALIPEADASKASIKIGDTIFHRDTGIFARVIAFFKNERQEKILSLFTKEGTTFLCYETEVENEF